MVETALLEASGIRKNFRGVQAVRGVNFSVRGGEVHALVGENGAGKSTLAKIMSGIVMADEGIVHWQGEPIRLDSPAVAKRLGIHTIHQELELAPALTVGENIFMGDLPGHFGLLDRKGLDRRASEVLTRLGATFGPRALVRDLRVQDRQVVEIAKALVRQVRVLIMDEPTAALPPVEVDHVLERIGRLRELGVGIVYISHRLDEVLRIADRITVLRDGQVVCEVAAEDANRPDLIRYILGRELAQVETVHDDARAEAPSVDCRGLRMPPDLDGIDFKAGKGEIVGFFGLLGAGQSAIAEALFGLRRARAERVRLGVLDRLPTNPREAVRRRIGFVPADRKKEGVSLNLSILENILLPAWGRVSTLGLVNWGKANRAATAIMKSYDGRYSSLAQKVSELSGGNQQKVALGKWSLVDSEILLLEEPTRGVDVGAKVEIYRLLRTLVQRGGTCLLFSSDAEEIAIACDRAYVLRGGAIAGELRGSDLTVATLTQVALEGMNHIAGDTIDAA